MERSVTASDPANAPRAFKIDFIGVGAPKCGTTWLASCLREHPELCVADPTALNYFCENTIWPEFRAPSGLGLDWVMGRFAHCEASARLIEISPNYLYDKGSPARIFQHNPDCRLIFTFRHPVEMLTSFYYQIAKESRVAETIDDFLADYPEVRRIGLYHQHLQAFFDVFPRAQCHVVFFDDVQREPQAVVQRCFSFLGVASDFVPPSLNQRINERKTPRSKRLMVATNWIRHVLQKHISEQLWKDLVWKLKLYRLHNWILQRNLKAFTPVPIQETTRRQLLEFYREDTRALGRVLERDLSAWER